MDITSVNLDGCVSIFVLNVSFSRNKEFFKCTIADNLTVVDLNFNLFNLVRRA